MTRAPSNLLATRSLMVQHLGPYGLTGDKVGIVGDPAHRGGYHCGSDRVVPNDYSVVESPRDRAGLTLDAAALDVGQFRVTTPRGTFDLPHYSRWLVAQCAANTADTRDIREVIYSPDGTTVKRWDRLGRRSTGDSSHRWHTHQSYFRDAIKAGRDQTAVVRRYLTEIGLLEDDMGTLTGEQAKWLEKAAKLADQMLNPDLGMNVGKTPTPLHQVLRHMAWPILNGPTGSGAYLAAWMTGVTGELGIDADELAAITTAAREGAAAAADELVAAVVAKLPDDIGGLSREQLVDAVADGVRDAFAGGLAQGRASE
ncbi:hypothetical protein AB0C47_34820 [Micromonospora taraxaci]|uniref:hypothetical protein n=1 Tax=Micromonospora taraxaci TaxID=1316803 RepID=UPI00340E05FF